MTDDISADTLRHIHFAEVQAMSRDAQVRYLRSRGWRKIDGRLSHRIRGINTSFASALSFQARADRPVLSELEGTS